jgi:RimJ/RimL family protein N-acetyltransferase
MMLNGVSIQDIYTFPNHLDILYEILLEREPSQSISHTKMPTREEHKGFVDRLHYLGHCPYKAWYFIQKPAFKEVVGTVYLTNEREIGVTIFKRYHRRGYGKSAVELLMAKHPGEFRANINPGNHRSIEFFRKLGFKHIQNTYRLGQ